MPRGVACTVPGLPGSIRSGPKLTLPPACSQVMCLVRSTHAAAAAGQSLRSNAVSTSGASGTVGVTAAGSRLLPDSLPPCLSCALRESCVRAGPATASAADTAAPDAPGTASTADLGVAGRAAETAAIPAVIVKAAATTAVMPSLLAAEARLKDLPVALMSVTRPVNDPNVHTQLLTVTILSGAGVGNRRKRGRRAAYPVLCGGVL